MKLCVTGTLVFRLFAIGAAKECCKRSAGETAQLLLRSVFVTKVLGKKNLRLVPNWEAKNHFCTEMGQAPDVAGAPLLVKHHSCSAVFRRNWILTIAFSSDWQEARHA